MRRAGRRGVHGQRRQVRTTVPDRAAQLVAAAAYLAEIGPAREAAGTEERNEIAATLFERIAIVGDRIEVAIVRPEVAPFFILDIARDVQRKRQESNPRFQP